MTLTSFVRNYTDHSNDQGFQFEFHCDKCHNGWRSAFVANKLGLAASFFQVAGTLFGGGLETVAHAGRQAKDALRGKAWDDAFNAANVEGKAHFKHCSRCGIWVCPEACWNDERQLCENCAPDLGEEAAAAQAHAAKDQVWEKARTTDQTEGLDVKKKRAAKCPHCGAKAAAGKFCSECGKPFAPPEDKCGGCGAKMAAKAKFCAECGAPRA